ncbi:antigen peptide transporter 2-like [Hippocampus comes]|uniref:antigen peptide transporter 2-like n=1 Tax=Hippocampus comes TaxID=109280 RepID=UPI00094E47CD|nr:PREDICTED: antigen peptide transporter 2-like [Hippocampus comes]
MAAGVSRCWIVCAGASLAAASLWEVGVPDSPSGRRQKRQKPRVLFMRVLRMYRPDLALLLGGFCFLPISGIQIRYYTGKVIDNLREDFGPDDFLSALLLMGVFSVGSAVGAGSRGNQFLMWVIRSFKCRVKAKLFHAQTNQETAFFDTAKIVSPPGAGEPTSLLSKDIPLMAETVCLNINILLRTLIQTAYTHGEPLMDANMFSALGGPHHGPHPDHLQQTAPAVDAGHHDSMSAANETANEIILAVRRRRASTLRNTRPVTMTTG